VPCIKHDEKHIASVPATIRRATVPLRADGLNSVDLFNRPRFDVHDVLVAQLHLRYLCGPMKCVVVDALIEHFQHLNGGT